MSLFHGSRCDDKELLHQLVNQPENCPDIEERDQPHERVRAVRRPVPGVQIEVIQLGDTNKVNQYMIVASNNLHLYKINAEANVEKLEILDSIILPGRGHISSLSVRGDKVGVIHSTFVSVLQVTDLHFLKMEQTWRVEDDMLSITWKDDYSVLVVSKKSISLFNLAQPIGPTYMAQPTRTFHITSNQVSIVEAVIVEEKLYLLTGARDVAVIEDFTDSNTCLDEANIVYTDIARIATMNNSLIMLSNSGLYKTDGVGGISKLKVVQTDILDDSPLEVKSASFLSFRQRSRVFHVSSENKIVELTPRGSTKQGRKVIVSYAVYTNNCVVTFSEDCCVSIEY